jgi:hypothetical protein
VSSWPLPRPSSLVALCSLWVHWFQFHVSGGLPAVEIFSFHEQFLTVLGPFHCD